ncbi:MAG: hypothetical protein KKI09_15305 [Spirochaetes bacterium]|nr:hypothetical protein [Spirochaetota bacterium]MBU0956793.1 hypothetical protein [Spirochaetota bacterium]
MKHKTAFTERCAARGLDQAAIDDALRLLSNIDQALQTAGSSLDQASLPLVEQQTEIRLASVPDGAAMIMALARYFVVSNQDALSIRMLAYLLPIGVLPAMAERLTSLHGKEVHDRVMQGVHIPPVGSAPEKYPEATRLFTEQLVAELGAEEAHRVLAWNVHGIPAQAFAGESERLLELGSIDAWLADYHRRQVDILAKHAADGTLWYEQKITPAVVDFVRGNQELLSGRRIDDKIYQTKIPYNPDRYLTSNDKLERRKLACHCPLAAAGISETGSAVPAAWCSCSAGYEKFRFDVVFGRETSAAVLQSALDGSEICRYAVTIPERLPVPWAATSQ